MNTLRTYAVPAALLAATAGMFWYANQQAQPTPAPAPPVIKPAPLPDDCPDGKCPPKPRPKPSPWGTDEEATVGGPRHQDGTEIDCDLPGEFHQRNVGSEIDGAGLCVFASMRHSGRWANEPVFAGLFDWMKKHPGGSYPAKTTKMIQQFCKEKNLPIPEYLQVESNDLEVLKAACAAGLMPGVTYGKSPSGRYGGKKISHMVSLVGATDRHFVVLDNNYPGADAYEWLSPAEFARAYADTGGKGWAVIPLKPGPPPPPRNQPFLESPMFPSFALPLVVAITAAAPAQSITGSGYEWRAWPGHTESALLLHGRQIGSWNALTDRYRKLLPSGEWCDCGACGEPPVATPIPKFGVDAERLDGRTKYEVSGKPVTRQQAFEAIESAKIPDLKSKVRVTVIGAQAETAKVVADLAGNPALAGYKDATIVHAYEPSHWHVAQSGFKTDGKPVVIYVQSPDGKVLHRQDDYNDGAAGLAKALDATAIRKPVPDYKPAADKDARQSLPPDLPLTAGVIAALAGCAAVFTSRKKV